MQKNREVSENRKLQQLMASGGISAKKRYGQNFLVDTDGLDGFV